MTSLDRIKSYLNAYVEDERLLAAVNELINIPEFATCRSARNKHHAYEGGLAYHTWEVMNICQAFKYSFLQKQSFQTLMAAAAVHDVGKIYDYVQLQTGKFIYSDHGEYIRHVSQSFAMFTEAAKKHGLFQEQLYHKVAHCILTHHGRTDWGSPMEPKTAEAHMLHYADMLSSRFTSYPNVAPVEG